MLEFPAKGIFSANQVWHAGNLYDNKPHKIGGKQRLVTKYDRESRMFISDGMAYLSVRFPTNDDMDSYTKVTITPDGEWKP